LSRYERAGTFHGRRIGMLRKASKAAVLLLVLTVVTGCDKDQSRQVVVAPAAPRSAIRVPVPDGEALFKQFCANCHPDGGNASDPERTLRGSVLKRNHITSPEDIVRIMRNPLSRMIRFDAATLSDRDARAIAEYILVTFR
jgi:cytochrome c6